MNTYFSEEKKQCRQMVLATGRSHCQFKNVLFLSLVARLSVVDGAKIIIVIMINSKYAYTKLYVCTKMPYRAK